jgi:hypothetical protein
VLATSKLPAASSSHCSHEMTASIVLLDSYWSVAVSQSRMSVKPPPRFYTTVTASLGPTCSPSAFWSPQENIPTLGQTPKRYAAGNARHRCLEPHDASICLLRVGVIVPSFGKMACLP